MKGPPAPPLGTQIPSVVDRYMGNLTPTPEVTPTQSASIAP